MDDLMQHCLRLRLNPHRFFAKHRMPPKNITKWKQLSEPIKQSESFPMSHQCLSNVINCLPHKYYNLVNQASHTATATIVANLLVHLYWL